MERDTRHLWDALMSHGPSSGTLHCWDGARFEAASWSGVIKDARRFAAGLRGHGVRPGVRVASVLTNSPAAVRGILGTWLAGGAIASLPVPARGMEIEEYARQLAVLCGHVDPQIFVIDESLRGLLPEKLSSEMRVVSWESLDGAASLDPTPPEPGDIAFIQYSSGSTGTPKGCMLTARSIYAQLKIILAMLDGEPGKETVCSWLPLSHDMGLFGCLLYACAWDFDLVLSSPERFLHSPRTWFADMSAAGCTQSAGTSSALHLCARAQRSVRLQRELQLRSVVIGAERIEADTLDTALRTFAPFGLRPTALRPAYGLAEATLAVTATPTAAAPHARIIDAVALADGELREVGEDSPSATTLVSLGPPCAGVELRLAESDRLSEVHVRSPSLFSGYHADSRQTRARLRDGEVATGDLGFMHDGELYLVGRSDDLLSVAGRNVYAREIEAAIGALEAVRRGSCTIVDVPGTGTTHLSLLAELRDGRSDFAAIAAEMARTATAKAGINLSECVFLEKGALPKTPTGKVQRFRCRELLRSDGLSPLARISTGSPAVGARPQAPDRHMSGV
jgi:fatty-acyl-CoA synthase